MKMLIILKNMNKYRITIAALIALNLLSGCAGMKPSPKYTSDKGGSKKSSTVAGKSSKKMPLLSAVTRLNAPIKLSMLKSINKYKGVPYKWGGATMRGMDCSGFTMKVFAESAKRSLPHHAASQYKLGTKISRRRLKFGDLVFFRDIESKGVSHVGIYVGNDNFVHASLSKGVVTSSMNQPYYKKRYVSARRLLR